MKLKVLTDNGPKHTLMKNNSKCNILIWGWGLAIATDIKTTASIQACKTFSPKVDKQENNFNFFDNR